jgi:acetyl-CoA carboxylase biotin carboxyl carrier protein
MDGNRQHSHDVETDFYEENEAARRVSVEQLQRLVHLLDGSDVSEIEVKCADTKMRLVLRKAKVHGQTGADDYQMMALPGADTATAVVTSPVEKKHTVTASLVGVFHSWVKPKTAPLINVGDHVKIGQVLGTIQSLNVLNEVESLVAGRVVEIFVQDGQPVEYGQPLMAIDSSEES